MINIKEPDELVNLKIGEYGMYSGQVVVRYYGGLVSLSDPNNSWCFSTSSSDFKCRKLNPGTVITITVDK